MNLEAAQEFAQRWVGDWNAHDLDRVTSKYADDVTWFSPSAAQLLGTDGVMRGKPALRAYLEEVLRRVPDLQFELLGVYAGVKAIVINYRGPRGVVSEVMMFDGDVVTEGHSAYA